MRNPRAHLINLEPVFAAYYGAAFEAKDKFTSKYASPHEETSIFIGVPIRYLETFKALFGQGYLIKYRGKSKGEYVRPQAYCHKDYADTFAVYKK